MRAILMTSAVLAASVLAGCDSTTSLTSADQDYNTAAMAYNDMRSEVLALPFSTSVDMPNRGTATYNGYSTILMDTPAADSALVGDAQVVANFDSGSITGSLTNFVGSANGTPNEEYTGSIALFNGDIGSTAPSRLTADINGTLRSDTNTVSINGDVAGNFRSDGALNAAALTASESASTDFFLNGREYSGDIGIVAQR